MNFLPADPDKTARRQTLIVAAVFTVLVAGVGAVGAGASFRAASRGTTTLSEVAQLPLFSDLQRMVGRQTAANPAATPQSRDRMNILVLGIGGEGHDGPLLTDTILLASADLKNKKIGLLSLPRDLAYPLGEGKFEKINAVNAYEEMSHPGEGAKRTGELLSSLLDVPIDHVVLIDFRGFVKLVDAVGGVDINAERAFTDNTYPTGDDTVQVMTVSFKKGWQHMDGERALVFTRSRHGSSGEGSDFARSRRQQLVLVAVRNKLLSLGTLTDPTKLGNIYTAISSHLQSDLNIWDMMKLAPLAQNFTSDKITMNVPSDAPDGLLVAGNVDGAFMLFPRKPDWSEIKDLAQNPFTSPADRMAADQPAVQLKLEIKNGTPRTGFASQVAVKLEKSGYEINSFGNASRRGYEGSVIYDLTGGKQAVELARLRRLLGAEVSAVDPGAIKPLNGSQIRSLQTDNQNSEKILAPDTDFLIILGDTGYAYLNTPTPSSTYATTR